MSYSKGHTSRAKYSKALESAGLVNGVVPREKSEELKLKKKELELLSKKHQIMQGLPHLYGFKHYTWSRIFFEATQRMALLTAANQIGKSTVQVRKLIHWATEPSLWPKLWPKDPVPRLFWYLYPDLNTATTEFHSKWVPTLLPRGEYIESEKFGWKAQFEGKKIKAIHFNSGVMVEFRSYAQDVSHLQASSPHAIFCDEELPMDYYSEILMRLQATEGYFSMVFTATLNQDFWRRAMERVGKDDEVLPDALKMQVSMYDCENYEDGKPSHWTRKKIEHIKSLCSSEAEVLRRVYGRFVLSEGRRFPAFDPATAFVPVRDIPESWVWYSAVDPGSGGAKGHPAAMVMIAVSPDHKQGVVARGLRLDGVQTTASDILDEYRRLRGDRRVSLQIYDFAAADFGIIAGRLGETFIRADKSHERGEDVVNTLFKGGMLKIFDTPELRKLGVELSNLPIKKDNKRREADDFADALRYCCIHVPWDWSAAAAESAAQSPRKLPPKTEEEIELAARRGERLQQYSDEELAERDFDNEVEEWNSLYEGLYE